MQQFSVCQFLDEVCELSANAQAKWLRVLQEGEYEQMGDTSVRHDKEVLGVTPEVVQALQAYDWPGNIRELENIIERGMILAHHHGRIELAGLFPSITLAPASEPAVPVLAAPPRTLEETVNLLLDRNTSREELERIACWMPPPPAAAATSVPLPACWG